MDEALEKVRAHASSTQKGPATLLAAVDSILDQQATAKSPTAYLTALVSTLESLGAQGDRDLELGALSLLALVNPHVPSSVIRQQHVHILAVVAPALQSYTRESHQPALKAVLAALAPVYRALSAAELKDPTTKRLFVAGLLPLVGAPQPKLRRVAQSLVAGLLSSPPAPSVSHPYAKQAGELVVEEIETLLSTAKNSRRGAVAAEGSSEASGAIGLLGFVRQIGKDFPSSHLSALIAALLALPRLGNAFLTTSAYGVLEALFSQSSDSFEPGKVESTLLAVLEEQPDTRDERLLPGWLDTIEHGWVALARVDPAACRAQLAKDGRLGSVLALVGSESPLVRKSAASCAAALCRYCLADDDIFAAVASKGKAKSRSPVQQVLKGLLDSLSSLKSAPSSLPALMTVLASLIVRLRVRPTAASSRSAPAAASLVAEHVKLIGDLRGEAGFEYRESADAVLGSAAQVCGPEWLLALLPLNIEETLTSGGQGRGWLLPLLRSGNITNARLGHFVEEMVPLSERLFERRKKALAADGKRSIEAKVCEGLVEQVWGLFPGYCDLPWDLQQAFNQRFAELISSVLYTQTALRQSVFRGLQVLVERNRSLARSAAPPDESLRSFGLAPSDAAANIDLLARLAPNLLAVFFNVYAKAGNESRGFILECVSAYLGILSSKDLEGTSAKVQALLEQSLKSTDSADQSSVLLDLLIAMVPFADPKTATSLFSVASSPQLLDQKSESAVQKKAYRILARLCESKKASALVQAKLADLAQIVVGKASSVSAGAKRDRCLLILALVPILPSSQLHHIPTMLPEVVLGTKEHNAETREASYEVLVKMGKRLGEGGVVRIEAAESTAQASTAEFFTMISAGLAGTSPHMISASIGSLSRALFEFHGELSPSLISDLLSTAAIFLGSANGEIVKSSVGFVKVAVVCLAPELVRPHLAAIIPNLLRWSREHKNHFKLNIRHIFERLLRKYGEEEVLKHVGEPDRKLISSIRKKQRRAKAKKDSKADEPEEEISDVEPAGAAPKSARDAFEQALYGSDSEDGGEAEEDGMRLDEDEGEPLDLLDRKLASRLSTGKASKADKRRQKHAKEATALKTEDGRLVIEDDDQPGARAVDSTDAYLEALKGEDSFTRNSKGKLKFNQKRSREQDELEAVEEVEGALAGMKVEGGPGKKKRKAEKERLGQEFKAKKAGGDVTRAGVSPYAYLPLSSAGRKDGARVDITGKKRNSRR